MEREQNQYSDAGSTQLGKVEIAPEVLQIISGLAALQVDGVAGTSGGVVSDLTQFLGRKTPKQGIKVDLDEEVRIHVWQVCDCKFPIIFCCDFVLTVKLTILK